MVCSASALREPQSGVSVMRKHLSFRPSGLMEEAWPLPSGPWQVLIVFLGRRKKGEPNGHGGLNDDAGAAWLDMLVACSRVQVPGNMVCLREAGMVDFSQPDVLEGILTTW